MKRVLILSLLFILAFESYSQNSGSVIITEIANAGSKKSLYNGGEYVELEVLKDGTCLAGWFITDLPSLNSTAKETQGSIFFSDTVNSIFNAKLSRGTRVLVCLGSVDQSYGNQKFTETQKISDSTKLVVCFPYDTTVNSSMIARAGKMVLTGKDNVALVSKWDKNSAVDVVSWGREIKWQGCTVINIAPESLENGYTLYLKAGTPPEKRTDVNNWVSTSEVSQMTPGAPNK